MKTVKISLICIWLAASPGLAATYQIDPDHSSVEFKIKHLAISSVTGSFLDFSGTFDFDPANPGASKTDAQVKVHSIDTRQKKRDDHLRSEDFFAVSQFPEMRFVSKHVTPTGKDTFTVSGDLTVRGTTRPVTMDVQYGGSTKDMQGKERAAFSATARLNRKEFGLNWNKLLETGALVVGDEVTVNLEIEGIKQG